VRFDLLVRGGTLVTEEAVYRADLGVRDGRIAAQLDPEETPQADELIDGRRLYVLPGLVDAHVHFNEPGRTHWEGYETGSAAAAVGGVTTVLDMPLNSDPPTLNAGALAEKRRAVAGRSLVDYGHWGGLVTDNLADLDGLERGGVVGYKAFMCDSGITEFPAADDGVLLDGFERIGGWGNILGLHAENDALVRRGAERLRSCDRRDPRAWAGARPPVVELEAVQRGLLLARQSGGRAHFVHLSTAAAARAVASARARGQAATAETCPHYLALDEDDLERLGAVAKCAPPLRTREEVEALWECVLDGSITFVASDHSPCSPEEKQRGGGDIWQSWGGISGVQTSLAVMLTEGVHRRGLALTRLVSLLSANPACLFGLYPRKGSLAPGADADLALVDLEQEWTLRAGDLRTRHELSPFLGRRFKGRVMATLVRGKLVARDGEPIGPPGHGQLLVPSRLGPHPRPQGCQAQRGG